MPPRGSQLGRFLILDTIGAGGMGVVLRAYDTELDRGVAIKLVRRTRRASSGGDAEARFLREARAIAQLSHPNVVAVHDVGRIDDELFLAMELVEGTDLGTWLATPRKLPEILAIFVQAGRGLAAAHTAGIVHRDFKPGNVLVGADGRVRVADFGLARSTRSSTWSDEASTASGDGPVDDLTHAGVVVGTPAYLAPEIHRGKPADARSDQFAFCVALYEAVCGARPFTGEDMAALRATVTAGLVRPIPRDAEVPLWLRTLLMRGLARRAADRFPSMDVIVAELARDRGARRRRLLIAGSLGLAVAATGVAAVGWHDRDARGATCDGAERKLAGVWDDDVRGALRTSFARAAPAGELADRVTAVLDRRASAWTAMHIQACQATWVHGEQSEALLDRRMACLDRRLGEQRALTRLLIETPSADLLGRAVDAAYALPDLAACADVAALEAALPPPPAATAARIAAVFARVDDAWALERAGDYARGRDVAAAAADDARALTYPPLTAAAQYRLGSLAVRAGDVAGGRAAFDAALDAAVASHDPDLAAHAWIGLIMAMRTQARHQDALALVRAAELAVHQAGDKPALRAALLGELGELYTLRGDYERARVAYVDALALVEQLLAPGDPALARAVHRLGVALWYQGKLADAMALEQRALELRTAALGAGHPEVAASLNTLGLYYQEDHKYEASAALLERSIATYEAALGPRHAALADPLSNLVFTYRKQRHFDAARIAADRALAIDRSTHGDDHPSVGIDEQKIGELLADQGRHAEALAHVGKARALYVRVLGDDHPYVGRNFMAEGNIRMAQARPADAVVAYQHALAIIERTGDPVDIAGSRFALAQAMVDAGAPDLTRAIHLATQAGEGFRAAGSPRADEIAAWLAKHR